MSRGGRAEEGERRRQEEQGLVGNGSEAQGGTNTGAENDDAKQADAAARRETRPAVACRLALWPAAVTLKPNGGRERPRERDKTAA